MVDKQNSDCGTPWCEQMNDGTERVCVWCGTAPDCGYTPGDRSNWKCGADWQPVCAMDTADNVNGNGGPGDNCVTNNNQSRDVSFLGYAEFGHDCDIGLKLKCCSPVGKNVCPR